jgi:hypothetical protein
VLPSTSALTVLTRSQGSDQHPYQPPGAPKPGGNATGVSTGVGTGTDWRDSSPRLASRRTFLGPQSRLLGLNVCSGPRRLTQLGYSGPVEQGHPEVLGHWAAWSNGERANRLDLRGEDGCSGTRRGGWVP